MRWMLALAAIAACGSDAHHAPACADAVVCGGACPVAFSGNFAESTLSGASCATVTTPDTTLAFSIDSSAIGSPLAVSIDLGSAPGAGAYSSETIASWTAVAAKSIGDGGCVFSAGTGITPTGSFTLSLTAIDAQAAHGTLEIVQYVHALQGTDCGVADTETIDVVF